MNLEVLLLIEKVYILNKDFYSFLDRESFIDISRIKQTTRQDLEAYEKNRAIHLKEVWILNMWDKYLMLSQIEINLIESKSQWIKSLSNTELESLLIKNKNEDGKIFLSCPWR